MELQRRCQLPLRLLCKIVLLALLLWPTGSREQLQFVIPSASHGFAVVGSWVTCNGVEAYPGSTISCTLSQTPTSGQAVLGVQGNGQGNWDFTSVSVGTLYNFPSTVNDLNGFIICNPSTSSATIVFTPQSIYVTYNIGMIIVSGVNCTSSPVDAGAGVSTNYNPPTSTGSVTAAAAYDEVCGFVQGPASTYAAGSNFTAESGTSLGGGQPFMECSNNMLTSGNSLNPGVSITGGNSYTMGTVALILN